MLNNDKAAVNAVLKPPATLGAEFPARPEELPRVYERITLYLRAAGLPEAEAAAKAGLAIDRALETIRPPFPPAGLLKEAWAQAQFFIVCPLARPRPLSLGHMLPEGFEDMP